MPQSKQQLVTFEELLDSATRCAAHLEMRDSYAVDYEKSGFAAWKDGRRLRPEDRQSWWTPWLDLIARTTARGVAVRRARVVSEPVSEYTRFLHSGTFKNIAAGEEVKWLPRRQVSGIALPGNDFWVFDDHLVRFNHFSGDGDDAGVEHVEDPEVIRLCRHAFEAVWERGVPHQEYEV
ncbi:DUF6879 family protein [Streptomyces sp. 796.1]|uniref:DUF6879 family protein n=1 Tax=Streptomyces sp. 796.1 TaxID=3163029 RepID=UPI0039C933A3